MTRQTCKKTHGHGRKGPTSYHMHDPDEVFRELALQPGQTFADLGCGPGDYSLRAAREVGKDGLVLAVDQNPAMVRVVEEQCREHGLTNVVTHKQDMSAPLPFPDQCVDTCLLSTSLHCMDIETHGPALFRELHRILKTGGHVAVLECKKERMNFGPPLSMRISERDVDAVALPCGFSRTGYTDLGFNYLVRYRKD